MERNQRFGKPPRKQKWWLTEIFTRVCQHSYLRSTTTEQTSKRTRTQIKAEYWRTVRSKCQEIPSTITLLESHAHFEQTCSSIISNQYKKNETIFSIFTWKWSWTISLHRVKISECLPHIPAECRQGELFNIFSRRVRVSSNWATFYADQRSLSHRGHKDGPAINHLPELANWQCVQLANSRIFRVFFFWFAQQSENFRFFSLQQ